MPNAYAQYQDVRAKALELRQTVQETFPKGKASDPTGGAMYEKADKKLVVALGQMFRRRDELCFFLLFHQAGIFSEDELAQYDSRPISIRLEPESSDWPDDTPAATTALSAEDATFVSKYLPETNAGYERLGRLFDEGARQFAELRQTALALDAPRARCELMMLKTRLGDILETLQKYEKSLSMQRLNHALGDTTVDQLAALDQDNAAKIQELEREMGVKAYVSQCATRLFVTLPGGAIMEMVWCPPGTFMMGRDDGHSRERPRHQVTLTKGFWMGRTEVTQKQWKSVMGDNPSHHEGDNLPVESGGNWREFCKKTSLQLPTEAQWEYACRAGSTGKYAGTGNLDEMGWHTGNSGNKPHPVGTKQPNVWGLYDMHGSVWELCADWYDDYPSGAVTDPKGSPSFTVPVLRGGSWRNSDDRCTSSFRGNGRDSWDGIYSDAVGFRLVKNPSE